MLKEVKGGNYEAMKKVPTARRARDFMIICANAVNKKIDQLINKIDLLNPETDKTELDE